MNLRIHTTRQLRQNGLTILEILVSSALMVIIILGLLLMFNQTQRAFKSSLRQVDVLEGGRAIMDIVVRDLEQLTTPGSNEAVSLSIRETPGSALALNDSQLLLQTNEVFILYPEGDKWKGVRYWLMEDTGGISTLYRDELYTNKYNIPDLFTSTTPTAANAPRVATGIVHFRFIIYSNGWPVEVGGRLNITTNLPSAIDFELGIAEPALVEQMKGMPSGSVSSEFLKKQAGKIHMFRQRVPIRTATR